ncbi:hypothetical protein NPX13_g2335 [Xylaria arbuscula]|uniref:Uncharacterized protein n=1 Tax=Xylaria arbuscula TaxID=114810 RepID=A0A9W8TR55_9PEZI|nr:hypothetical protein NPX13_g2335 [Xylaria arbuscula]
MSRGDQAWMTWPQAPTFGPQTNANSRGCVRLHKSVTQYTLLLVSASQTTSLRRHELVPRVYGDLWGWGLFSPITCIILEYLDDAQPLSDAAAGSTCLFNLGAGQGQMIETPEVREQEQNSCLEPATIRALQESTPRDDMLLARLDDSARIRAQKESTPGNLVLLTCCSGIKFLERYPNPPADSALFCTWGMATSRSTARLSLVLDGVSKAIVPAWDSGFSSSKVGDVGSPTRRERTIGVGGAFA